MVALHSHDLAGAGFQPGKSSSVLPMANLLGFELADADRDSAIDWLLGRLRQNKRTTLAFLNAQCVNVAARNVTYRASLRHADALLPDGSGIALASLLARGRSIPNLNGTDLVPLLCERLVRSGHSVFLLGARPGIALRAAQTLRRRYPGLRIAGVRDGYFSAEDDDAVIGEINASGADVLIVAMGVPRQELWVDRVRSRLDAKLVMGVGGCFDFLSGRIPRAPALLRMTGLEWTYRLYQEPARMWRRYILGNPEFVLRACAAAAAPRLQSVVRRLDDAAKRAIDIAASGLALAVLSPLLLGIMAAIRLESPGSPIFSQIRVGENGKMFKMYKFRSMYRDAEQRRADIAKLNHHGTDGVTFKMKDDPRITRVGRLLRRSSMDELPQLWNILKGKMSLVGPRPPLPTEVMRYSEPERARLAGKPGLTCLWQVSGRANLPFERQVALDVEYLRHRSILLDFSILIRTVGAVVTARGAY
jgi:exopolysaccharide biosynthesis WecB/TagA/CpsF family protein